MDRKLKERLIGLVVLLTAAIIILPMILGGPDNDDTRSIRLDRERPAENLPVTRLDLREPDGRPAENEPEREQVDRDREQAVVAEPPAMGDAEPVEQVPAQAETGEDESNPPESETENESTGAEPEADTNMPSGSGWTAQVGSFSDRSNAEGLTRRLRDDGFEAFVMRHARDGNIFYRVRVGLEPEREDAQRLVERIRQRTGHEASTVPHP